MGTKEKILNKIQTLISNNFESRKEAFNFFDKDGDGKLKKSEIKKLLKKAKVSGFIRGIVANKLIDEYDNSNDEMIDWEEFKVALGELEEDV